MDEREALNYAANLLEAFQGASLDVEYTPAIGMLRRFADDAYLRSGIRVRRLRQGIRVDGRCREDSPN